MLKKVLLTYVAMFTHSYCLAISTNSDEDKLNKGAGGDLDKVELEDEEIVQRVQKGVGSRFYKNGRFSPKMEKGVHHFHSLISKFLFK